MRIYVAEVGTITADSEWNVVFVVVAVTWRAPFSREPARRARCVARAESRRRAGGAGASFVEAFVGRGAQIATGVAAEDFDLLFDLVELLIERAHQRRRRARMRRWNLRDVSSPESILPTISSRSFNSSSNFFGFAAVAISPLYTRGFQFALAASLAVTESPIRRRPRTVLRVHHGAAVAKIGYYRIAALQALQAARSHRVASPASRAARDASRPRPCRSRINDAEARSTAARR